MQGLVCGLKSVLDCQSKEAMKSLTFVLVAALACLSSIAQGQDVVVTLPNLGTLRGRTAMTKGNVETQPKQFYNFRNIPFAESVSGDRRFSQPVQLRTPLGSESEPYDATKSGPLCPQLGLSPESVDSLNSQVMDDIVLQVLENFHLDGLIGVDPVLTLLEDLLETPIKNMTFAEVINDLVGVDLSVDEDCLHLAVSTPVMPSKDIKQQSLLPVMFFIYGGGYFAGTQMKMNYDRLGHVNDFVLVAVNYRVGSLGFMCLDTDASAGNMGLLDQIVGLEWVQENIQYFGGDPSRVTIFGESAGSASVTHLVLSPLTQGLFSQAIGQSGSAVAPWAYDDQNNEFHTRQIASRVNCTQTDLDELVACLKLVSYTDLNNAESEWADLEISQALGLGFGGHMPCGQTKGARKVIEHGQSPLQILESGNYNPVPLIMGANLDEGLLPYSIADTGLFNETLKNDPDFLTNELFVILFRLLGLNVTVDQGMAIRDEYFTPDQLGNYEAMMPGMIDLTGALFLKDVSHIMVRNNYNRAPSFFYSLESRGQKSFHRIFDQLGVPELQEPEFPDGYAAHADDLQFLFSLDLPILLCDLGEFFTGLVNAFLKCAVTHPFDPEGCVVAPDSEFRQQYGECLDSHLLPNEQLTSDAMVKFWTNFAIYGDPTPSGSGLPTLPQWEPIGQNYIIFKDGASLGQDYVANKYHSTPQP